MGGCLTPAERNPRWPPALGQVRRLNGRAEAGGLAEELVQCPGVRERECRVGVCWYAAAGSSCCPVEAQWPGSHAAVSCQLSPISASNSQHPAISPRLGELRQPRSPGRCSGAAVLSRLRL